MNKPKSWMHVIAKEVADYQQAQGYNRKQALSIGWAEAFEEKLALIEAKYQGNFDPGYKFDCYCVTCKTGNSFSAPSSIKLFIEEHKDHNTKTLVIK